MIRRFCDKCGKEIDHRDSFYRFGMVRVNDSCGIKEDIPSDVEMCSDCVLELMENVEKLKEVPND